MQFSAMTLNMFLPDYLDPAEDHRVIEGAVEQTIFLANLGYNPWFTDHHFRGPWHSNPMQFAAYVLPQLPRDRFIGFGALSIPFYHPVRLVESMNLLDSFAKGKVVFAVGSGWVGTEPESLGVAGEYHSSGQAAEDMLDVMERLWDFKYGDPPYEFSVGTYNGVIKRRIMPAPYTLPHPTIIRAASREIGLVRAAQKGWPAFLGIFGANLQDQAQLYQRTLLEANHPPEVVENCLQWCSVDWMNVTVAKTDAEAKEREQRANAESLRQRTAFVSRHGEVNGPVIKPAPGKTTGRAYAAGGDMKGGIAGSPETVAEKVRAVLDAGVGHLHLRFAGEWLGETRDILRESAELFASEIMPRFASSEKAVSLNSR